MERLSKRFDLDAELTRVAVLRHWQNEYVATLDIEQVIELTREIHAGNPEALAAFERLAAEQAEYVRARAAQGPPTYENPAGKPDWDLLKASRYAASPGDRPGGDRGTRELLDREQNAARRRLGDLRH